MDTNSSNHVFPFRNRKLPRAVARSAYKNVSTWHNSNIADSRISSVAVGKTKENARDSDDRPQPLIDAWARRAMMANGFGDTI